MIVPLLLGAGVALAGPRGVVVDQPPPRNLEEAYEARRVALVVGIDQYDDPALGDLRFAAKDARDLSTALMDPAVGAFQVVYPLHGAVSREGFWAAFRAVTGALQRDDTFFLYIAGHGTLDLTPTGTQLYVLPSEASLARAAEEGIPLLQIEEAVAGLPAQARVTLLDTCHSGTGRSALSPATRERIEGLRGPLPPPGAYEISSYDVRLFSAHHHQPAIEDAKLQNGVYTHYFVEALRGAGDADGDSLVEVGEAFDWARDRTLEFTGGVQVPWLEATLVGRKDIFLAGDALDRRQAERAVIESLTGLPANTSLWVDGVRRGPGPLLPGRHDVALETDEVILRARVRVRPGQRLDLGERVARRQGQVALAAGLAWLQDPTGLPPFQGAVQARWLPRDVAGGRPLLGLQVGQAAGDIDAETVWPAGQVLVGAGLVWGHVVAAGPLLQVGANWRVRPDTVPEGSLLGAPGLHLHLSAGRAWLALEPTLGVCLIDKATLVGEPVQPGLEITPQLTVAVGFRLTSGARP